MTNQISGALLLDTTLNNGKFKSVSSKVKIIIEQKDSYSAFADQFDRFKWM